MKQHEMLRTTKFLSGLNNVYKSSKNQNLVESSYQLWMRHLQDYKVLTQTIS